MLGLIIRSLALILICCIAISAAFVFVRGRLPPLKGKEQARVSIKGISNQEITFKAGMDFDGRMEDGSRVSHLVYESFDGVKVTKSIIYFNSPKRARKELQSDLQKATQIIERDPKLNTNREQVGERVVLFVYGSSHEREPRAAVLWTNESEFHSIESSSLQHALALEKSFPY